MSKFYRPGSKGRKVTCEPKVRKASRLADKVDGRPRKTRPPEGPTGIKVQQPTGAGLYPAYLVQVKQSARMRRAFASDCKEADWEVNPAQSLAESQSEYNKHGYWTPRCDYYVIVPRGLRGALELDFLLKEGAEWLLSIDTMQGPRVPVIAAGASKVPEKRKHNPERTYVVVAPSKEPAKGSLDVVRQRTNGQFAPCQSENLTKAASPGKHVFLSEGEKKTAAEAEEVRRGLPVKVEETMFRKCEIHGDKARIEVVWMQRKFRTRVTLLLNGEIATTSVDEIRKLITDHNTVVSESLSVREVTLNSHGANELLTSMANHMDEVHMVVVSPK